MKKDMWEENMKFVKIFAVLILLVLASIIILTFVDGDYSIAGFATEDPEETARQIAALEETLGEKEDALQIYKTDTSLPERQGKSANEIAAEIRRRETEIRTLQSQIDELKGSSASSSAPSGPSTWRLTGIGEQNAERGAEYDEDIPRRIAKMKKPEDAQAAREGLAAAEEMGYRGGSDVAMLIEIEGKNGETFLVQQDPNNPNDFYIDLGNGFRARLENSILLGDDLIIEKPSTSELATTEVVAPKSAGLSDEELSQLNDVLEVADDRAREIASQLNTQVGATVQEVARIESNNRKGYARLNAVMNEVTNELLGEFTQGVPKWICADSIYKEDSSKAQLAGITMSTSSYGSTMERDILENTRTAVLEGEKTELSTTLYRYAVTLKLIGDPSNPEWRIYLYNSCTSESSIGAREGEDSFLEFGQLGEIQYFANHFAGSDLLIDCEEFPSCRFNQVCLEWSDEDGAHCVDLAFGDDDGLFKTTGQTGSLEC